MATTSENEPDEWPTEEDDAYGTVVNTIRDDGGNDSKDTWLEEREIGTGAQGAVWLQRKKSGGELRAVKKIHKSLIDGEISFKREVSHLARIGKNNLHRDAFVQFYGWYQSKHWYCIVMEYVEHGDLYRYLREFGEKARHEVREITRQLLLALEFLHKEMICHRDLKPQNVLIHSRNPIQVKIADFGLSKNLAHSNARTQVGTSGYQAPEQLRLISGSQRGQYDLAVDIWALGCVVHLILTSETPFLDPLPDPDDRHSVLSACEEIHTRPIDFSKLVAYCAVPKPAGRPTGKSRGKQVGTSAGQFPSRVLITSEVTEAGIVFVRRMLMANPRSRILPTDALRDRWLTESPDTEAQKQAIINEQFLALGINPRGIKKMIENCGDGLEVNDIPAPETIEQARIGELRFRAATRGYKSALHLLLRFQSNFDIDFRVQEWTSLQSASLRGHYRAVQQLLDMKADVNALPASKDGLTAIQAAAQACSFELVELLLNYGADVPVELGSGRRGLGSEAERHDIILELLKEWCLKQKKRPQSDSSNPPVAEVGAAAPNIEQRVRSTSPMTSGSSLSLAYNPPAVDINATQDKTEEIAPVVASVLGPSIEHGTVQENIVTSTHIPEGPTFRNEVLRTDDGLGANIDRSETLPENEDPLASQRVPTVKTQLEGDQPDGTHPMSQRRSTPEEPAHKNKAHNDVPSAEAKRLRKNQSHDLESATPALGGEASLKQRKEISNHQKSTSGNKSTVVDGPARVHQEHLGTHQQQNTIAQTGPSNATVDDHPLVNDNDRNEESNTGTACCSCTVS